MTLTLRPTYHIYIFTTTVLFNQKPLTKSVCILYYISHCRQWNQRYWANFDNYAGEGLAFLFIGGEGEASPGWLNYGMWYEYY